MISVEVFEILNSAVRTLVFLGLPVILVISAAGALGAVLQAVTSIDEPALGYAFRALALVVLLYVGIQVAARWIVILAESAFQ